MSPRRRPRTPRTLVAVAAAVVALTLAACSAGGSGSGSRTVTAGKLTIATGQPAYSPWVEGNKPQSGKGFEAAVAYAVAQEMGYAKDDVVWKRSTFDSAIAPGAKDWDMNIQQFSITAKRKQAVDFSAPYYTTTQAVVTTSGSKAADATSISALKGLEVGVATGTTSYDVAKDALGQPQVFNSNDDAVLALESGQIDAVVTDLPTAFYVASAELKKGKVVGQFPASSGTGDQFGIVLPKGSALTPKVSGAIRALKADGTLQHITTKWLSTAVDVPVLH
ncbi:amino acid ABC transporter substrate-binding protein [Curtobacterium sp. MCBD17_013]|uniref:ABC transporter substrate-binding protein n=1 Tax=Curtobacterium sp. MCBD17_013 TaxID=2175668 RepID=UPI000DAA495A|nr:ABC transporter substrate-binding protein [Curtobacterium sp. MCBD17_013]PZF62737.1 amino acid ABC transporter substrate-binding protein [Curtobacterium sp. MCBD17_013]